MAATATPSQLPCPAPGLAPPSPAPRSALPGVHKSQQSHDSGTYLDWSPEPELEPPGSDFVTVVSVEGAAAGPRTPVPLERTTPFVTVLSIGPPAVVRVGDDADAVDGPEAVARPLPPGAEEVSVYRLPGERLGFGLKFEGGAGALGGPGDAVRRLLIQSCAPESPASRALCSWGPLGEGDEILEIDQVPVNTLTKAECVHAMKESKVVMRLVVRASRARPVVCGELKKALAKVASPPPPIPPRKSRTNSGGSAPPSPPGQPGVPPSPTTGTQDGVGAFNSFGSPTTFTDSRDSETYCIGGGDADQEKQPLSRTSSASSAASSASRLASKRASPLTPRAGKRLAPAGPGLPGGPLPPDAEVYLDLLSLERGQGVDSESDDTNSSLSTVVALPSTSNSSLSASSPTTPGPAISIDLARLLGPFERLERELAGETQAPPPRTPDGCNGPRPEGQLASPVSSPASAPASAFVFPELQPPPSFQDAPLSYGHEDVRPRLSAADRTDAVPEDADPMVETLGEVAPRTGSGKKKRAPPPPPPRARPQPAPRGDRLPRLVHCVPKDGQGADALSSPASPALPEPLETLLERQHLLDLITPVSKAAAAVAPPAPPHEDMRDEQGEVQAEEGDVADAAVAADVAPVGPVEITEVDDDDLETADGEVTLRLPDLVMDSQHQDGEDGDLSKDEDGEDFSAYRRSLSSPLPTIGEDEDEDEAEQRAEIARSSNASQRPPPDLDVDASPAREDQVDGPVVASRSAPAAAEEAVGGGAAKEEEDREMAAIAQELLDGMEAQTEDPDADDSMVCEDGDCNNNNQMQQQQQQQQQKGGATSGPPLGSGPGLGPLGPLGPRSPMPVRSAGLPPLAALGQTLLGRSPRADHHGPAPPSASRQPPDGDEFPPRYHDPQLLAAHPVLEASTKGAPPPLPLTGPPGAAGCPQSMSPSPAVQAGQPADGRGWRKDERSERSVRDKIAMFTSAASSAASPTGPCLGPAPASATITRRLSNKFKSTEDVFHDTVDGAAVADAKLRSRSVVSVDRVGKPSADAVLSSSSSSAYSSFESTLTEPASAALPRKAGGVLARATSFNGQPLTRAALSAPLIAAPAVAVPTAPGASGAADEARKASLIALVEQRRRSISKLRGLVIPDKVPEASSTIVDLPEIKSKDAMLIASAQPQRRGDGRQPLRQPQPQPRQPQEQLRATLAPAAPAPVLSSPPWKSQGASNLPKYSPAFKRKSLTVRSSSTGSAPTGLGVLPSKLSHDLLIGDAKTSASTAFLSDSGRSAEEESDNDSAVSSSRSSISHGFSPPASPLLAANVGSNLHARASSNAGSFLRRTLSSDTTASASSTAASQAISSGSCSSSSSSSSSSGSGRCRTGNNSFDNRRVLKAQSVDAINRKNVLFSARCRSGCDLRTGSPLMQRDEDENGEEDEEDEEEELPVRRRDPREEIKELERMVSMADTDVESNDALSCDDSVNSSDDTLEPSRSGRVHYRPATLRDLPATDVKVAFLNDTRNGGIELDLHPVSPLPLKSSDCRESIQKNDDTFSGKVCEESRNVFEPPSMLSKPLSRKSSVDYLLNGNDTVDNGSRTLTSEVTPRLRNLKKRNASDPLFLERNGNTSLSPTALQAVSVNDIRKAFEKAELALSPTSPSPPNGRVGFSSSLNGVNERLNGSASSGSSGSGSLIPSHARGSSIDSTTSEDGFPGHLSKEQFGSITSLASTTSLISQQELQQLIDDANQTLEEASNNGTSVPGSSHEVLVIILHRETAGASVGITLAGGADYETKEITVHKVLSGSPAERDGRLQKGDRILSINGRNMKGVTHRESLAILKAPRPEVVLVVSRSRGDVSRSYEEPGTNTSRINSRPPRILEQPIADDGNTSVPRGPPVNIVLQKDGAGLGFSLEGGKESPLGDRPLTVKKIFTGGCAEKSGSLQAGDELLSVNNTDVTKMSRIEAWGLMKRLPNGSVTLTVRHACINASDPTN